MKQSRFYVDQSTGTFADELLAAGFIRLLQHLFDQQNIRPSITQVDCGYYYEVTCDPPLDLEKIEAGTQAFAIEPMLRTEKNRSSLPPDLPDNDKVVVDYEAERDQRSAYITAYKELDKSAKRAELLGEEHPALKTLPPAPHPDWDIFRLLNPAALIGYNTLMAQWYEIGQEGQTAVVARLLCDLFGQTPNDVETIRAAWRAFAKDQGWKLVDATASQFYNPSQGKGINRAMPNGVGLSNLKNFWLLEWLKVIGLYRVGFTRTLQGRNDRKTYVLAPGRLNWAAASQIQHRFKQRMRFRETAVRSDILTVLRYLQAFIQYVADAQEQEPDEQERQFLEMLGDTWAPADFMHGFHTTFYKDLGNAVATMNISFLNLPGWVIIRRPEDVEIYEAILDEHEQVIRQLTEDRGEQLNLLMLYRDFIVADNLDPFFQFTTAFSSYLISQGERAGFSPRRFSTSNLRRLIVNNEKNLRKILNSPGFVNIAYAIRQSTVTAQYRKKAQNDRRYDVRYGLGRDLVRQSQYPEEFVAALSDFIHKYNAENAQVMETRSGPYRRSVQTSDIQSILELIDEYGSDLIAKLLVAYGYARDPRPQDTEQ